MENKRIVSAYELLAEKYNELIDSKPHNAYYDRPNTLALLPDVKGKVILDAACGPGKYAEIVMAAGATVTGFDLSPKMIELAKLRNGQAGDFFVHDLAQRFHMLPDAQFDIVLCALAMHYLKDWSVTIQEFSRVLRPGGLLILSIEHPFHHYRYHKAQNYFTTEPVASVWRGFGPPVEVPCYRMPLTSITSFITNNGFYIDQMVEPLPTADFLKADPAHYKELSEFPLFLCVRAVKRS